MNIIELFETFEKIFDTPRCLNYLNKIYENDKYFNFSAFEKTALNCVDFMQKAGLADIELLPVKADGKTPYGDWVVPQAWDAEYAVLKSVGEDSTIFADYLQTPCSLVMYSAPTPLGGITAEAVIADEIENLDINLLQGKIIVTSRPVRDLVSVAKKSGALGIVSDYLPLFKGVRDNLDEMRNVSRWDSDFIIPINNTSLFAFSLSPENGGILRNLILENQAEPFYLSAEVRTKFYDGECYTVSGKIKGETEDSVCIYGHLYEPGAHDNASGCALILELAACINDAVKRGVLPKPKRTLDFVVGYECTGSMAWITAKERNAVCGFVADMVGTDVIDNTHMYIWHAPMSNISFADAYICNIIESYKKHKNIDFIWENKKFSLGTDNILGDPYFKIPLAAMVSEPALSYHSSFDVPERIEKDVIFRNGVITGTYLFGLAMTDTEEAEQLWKMTVEYINGLFSSDDSETANIFKREILNAARQSMIAFCPDYIPDEINISEMPEAEKIFSPPDYADEKACLIPKRQVAGCLTFKSRPELSDSKWNPAWNTRLNLPLFWADGKRNLWEVAVLSAIEMTETREYSADAMRSHWEWLSEYFLFLSDNGYLTLE